MIIKTLKEINCKRDNDSSYKEGYLDAKKDIRNELLETLKEFSSYNDDFDFFTNQYDYDLPQEFYDLDFVDGEWSTLQQVGSFVKYFIDFEDEDENDNFKKCVEEKRNKHKKT